MDIPGECICTGRRARVRVSQLSSKGCVLECATADLPAGCEFALWIGAIGPLAVTAIRDRACHIRARFKESLDERVVEHFEST